MLLADNPFWQFSTRVYAAPEVAPECIELQDRNGIDVNVLLFAAWLGADRRTALAAQDIERITKAIKDWSDNVVTPLRATRRKLKLMSEMTLPAVQALRSRIAEVELAAEQLEQAFLYALAADIGRPMPGNRQRAIEGNVAAVLNWYGVDERAAYPKHLHAACGAAEG